MMRHVYAGQKEIRNFDICEFFHLKLIRICTGLVIKKIRLTLGLVFRSEECHHPILILYSIHNYLAFAYSASKSTCTLPTWMALYRAP